MSNLRRQLLLNAFKLWDIGLMLLAFLAASVSVLGQSHAVSVSEFFAMRVKITNFLIFSLFLFFWHVTFSAFGLYASRRLGERRKEVLDVVKATTLGTLFVLAGSLAFQVTLARPLFFAVFWTTVTLTSICSRLVMRMLLARVRKNGRNLRDVLVVGANGRALAFVKKMLAHPELGYRVIGFVDQEWDGLVAVRDSGFELACDFKGVPQFLRDSVVDEVVMALPMRSMHYQASKIAAYCEEQGITVRQLSNIFDLKLARSSAEDMEGDPLITHRTGAVESSHQLVK